MFCMGFVVVVVAGGGGGGENWIFQYYNMVTLEIRLIPSLGFAVLYC